MWLSVLNRNIETSSYLLKETIVYRLSVPNPKAEKECVTMPNGALKVLSNENRGGSKINFTNPTG